MFSVLKVSLFFVIATAVLGVGNSEHAAAGNINNIGHGGRKLAETPSPESQGFINIDCGSDEDNYIAPTTGIPYKSDKGVIDTGIAKTVMSGTYDYQLLKKLRSFPQGKRNCYTLQPKQGKNNKYLIRARFAYGNYDGKDKGPVFDLYLGVNKWRTVDNTDNSYYEIIHVASRDYIDVCLVNIGQGVPFISALELRHLDSSIYQIQSAGALSLLFSRRDVGRLDSTNSVIRYPGDAYDRLWYPMPSRVEADWIQINNNSTIDASSSESSDQAYRLPAEVMNTAAKTQNASIPLKIYYDVQPGSLSKYYCYFHFAEVEKLEPDQQRELTISLNGKRYLTETVKLDYLNSQTIVQDNLAISDEAWLNFSIKAAPGTQLPPILNAYEFFELKELPIEPTDTDDLEAIMDIKKWYKVRRNWQGDPCVPSNYSWDGLNCNDDNPPRIISLNLSSSNLTGDIATSFSKLELLQSLDLRGNKFTGSIPEALLEQSRNGKLDLRVDANPDVCLYTTCKREKKKKFVTPVIASSIVAVLFLLFIFSALCTFCFFSTLYQTNHMTMPAANLFLAEVNVSILIIFLTVDMVTKSSIKSKNRQYSYSEVVKITNNFKNIIGKGGFGNVYLGKLKDEIQVAVKLLSPSSNQGYKEFRAEAQLLMVVHHRNLVTLVGYCDDGENKALIYEYMANGNLQHHLSVTNPNVLTWNERLCVAVDTAHGLEYLHNGCKPPIIHRDLKPSNILLNENMQAKIADFGLSRAFATESDSHVSTCPAGTLGYVDPEIPTSGNFNKKSDVYSFGIILFELITGRPAIIRGPMRNNHILDWVYPLIERADIQNIVDPRLEGEFNTTSAWKVVEIAMSCALPVAIQRPDMSQVLAELNECLALVLTRGRNQRMTTECRTSSMPHNMFHLVLESEIAPTAR
ncbi:putative leucine-rich repeat receptor-like serine/threonine-protein kinase At2g19230 [Juglans microcarpa x Juglans regia]|uniref:putative leucine-rich repeat receptor-like serine/threonine-protein kinase At2g19230 n=1 Tax=Juglans microcarpa x Juglans regia TaxID=2249226 RepID=UPI001B7E7396|nr:putative leucine-rich repeat receptor-like serine/threonine-protein kinase At2g19230 [Juglans microcarpa x Juglans regia]